MSELADPMHDPDLPSPRRSGCPCGCGLDAPTFAPSTPPRSVSRDDFIAAVEPLLELLGVSSDFKARAFAVYDKPGLTIENNVITFTLAGHVVTEAAARNVTVGDAPEFAEQATEVRVQVR